MNTPFFTDQSSSEQVQVPPEVIERLKNVSSGSLTTELFRKGLRQCFLVGLKPMNPKAAKFAGEAFTLRMIPAREDVDTYTTLTPYPNPANLQWEAVENIGPGQVLVIDSRNDPRAASAGAMLPTRLKVRGAAAIVTDGSFRDGQELAELDFPAYARMVVASTRLSFHHVADLNVPISCADVAVYPGDILVGDGDGVTVVPRRLAAEMADLCEARDQFEKYLVLPGRGRPGPLRRISADRPDPGRLPGLEASRRPPGRRPHDPRGVRPMPVEITPAYMEAEIRRYFDACNAADYDALMSCFTPDAVHYFPPGLADIPWRGARHDLPQVAMVRR